MGFSAEDLQNFLDSIGVDLFGFGHMSEYDRQIYGLDQGIKETLPYAISIGVRLLRGVLETTKDGPNLLYFHHYRQTNLKLDGLANEVAKRLEREGFKAIPFPASQIVDWKRQLGHISHKHIGVISGLGWIGRNNLLVNPKYGSGVRYTTILTDMELPRGEILGFGCGECTACLSVCPAGSIKIRPEEFDHIGCYEKITEMKNKRNIGQHICGICVEVCRGSVQSYR